MLSVIRSQICDSTRVRKQKETQKKALKPLITVSHLTESYLSVYEQAVPGVGNHLNNFGVCSKYLTSQIFLSFLEK